MNQTKNLIKTLSICLVLLIGATIVSAWTGPSANPPADNEEPPINISTNTQYKAGALGIGGILTAYNQLCLGGVCRTDWPSGGTGSDGYIGDSGTHTAGDDLDMNGNTICLSNECKSDWLWTVTAGNPYNPNALATYSFAETGSYSYGVPFEIQAYPESGYAAVKGDEGGIYMGATSAYGPGEFGGGEFSILWYDPNMTGTKELAFFGTGDGRSLDIGIYDGDLNVYDGDLDMNGNNICLSNECKSDWLWTVTAGNPYNPNALTTYSFAEIGSYSYGVPFEIQAYPESGYAAVKGDEGGIYMGATSAYGGGEFSILWYDPNMTGTKELAFFGAGGGRSLDIGIYDGDLNMNGNDIKNVGNITYFSDISLKKDIKNLENSLQKLKNIRGVSFRWKDEKKGGALEEKQIGLIAQEVEDILPELVQTDKEEGLKSIDYAKLTAVLIEALKEQQEEIEENGEKIKNLEQRIDQISSQIKK